MSFTLVRCESWRKNLSLDSTSLTLSIKMCFLKIKWTLHCLWTLGFYIFSFSVILLPIFLLLDVVSLASMPGYRHWQTTLVICRRVSILFFKNVNGWVKFLKCIKIRIISLHMILYRNHLYRYVLGEYLFRLFSQILLGKFQLASTG